MGWRRFRFRLLTACLLGISLLLLAAADSVWTYGTSPADVARLVSVAKSGPLLDAATNTFNATITVTNTSKSTIGSPLRVVIADINPGSVTLANAAGKTSQGFAYIDLPNPGGVAPGASIDNILLEFNNPQGKSFTFAVDVLASSAKPSANAGPDQLAVPGDFVRLDGSKSCDAAGHMLTYTWAFTSLPRGSQAVLSDTSSVTPSFLLDLPGDYVVSLVVGDGTTSSDASTVLISTIGVPAVANAGPDRTVPVGNMAELNGAKSYDLSGNPLTYAWSFLSKPAQSNAALSNPKSCWPNFLVDWPGDYLLQLVVNDGTKNSLPATVSVATANSRPVADAGQPQTVFRGRAVQLDGSSSSDADNNALTYKWCEIYAPAASKASLSGATSARPSVTPDLAGAYVFQLIVNDGQVDSLPDTVLIKAVDTTAVPNVVGVSRAGAVSELAAAGLAEGAVISQKSAAVSAGNVISQSPAAGTTVAVGSSVGLVISLGSAPVTVPDVVGMSEAEASSAITGAGLTVGEITRQMSGSVASGEASSETPSAGTSVAKGSAVALVISLGPSATVPDVVGKTQADASSAITKAGLALGAATTRNSSTVSAGSVISEAPPAGTCIPQGYGVYLVVSAGPPPTLPSDPTTVAPPVDPTAPTETGSATAFLYTGSNPIQTGVASGTLRPKRAAVIRGKVLAKDGSALSGVTVSILNHPELGQTLSRTDGMFDLAVNGGGLLTVDYQKGGYLPVQRQVSAPWQNYAFCPDVVMVPVDPKVTAVDLTSSTPVQVARASTVTDTDGTRTATLLFDRGTTAALVMGDGSTQPLTSLHVRATEFTVGSNGPDTMPAPLPPTSGYTYAFELSADEAIAAGAKSVNFTRPVIEYVDNFIGFPVGMHVPVGYYDRAKGQWVPSPDGRVIKILSITDNMADLDIDGSGKPAGQAALSALGVTDAERARLAGLYTPGQSLWRVAVTHFTAFDCNLAYGLPSGAEGPKEQVDSGNDSPDDPCVAGGSVIGCESQTLGEDIAVTGTGLKLHYNSSREAGYVTDHTVRISLTGASVPESLKRVDLVITVAGRQFKSSFPPSPNQQTTFTWDGLDAYGRTVQGVQLATVQIGYVYPAVYYGTVSGAEESFASVSGVPVTASGGAYFNARSELILWQYEQIAVGSWTPQAAGLGGWTLSEHHAYDPKGKRLYLGDGRERGSSPSLTGIITTVAGNGSKGFSGDGGPATMASLSDSLQGVAAGPDGSIYIDDCGNNRIRKVDTDGIITTVAGNGSWGFSGDGGPATKASLAGPTGVAVGADGSIYISDGGCLIRKVSPEGIITTVAGNGHVGYSGDGGPATEAMLFSPYGIALGSDGSIYIADAANSRIRKVGSDGTIITVAGNGSQGYSGDGGPATKASLDSPVGVALGPDGSLYIADSGNNRIRKVGPDGIITTVAGNGTQGDSGDGGPAAKASLFLPSAVATGPDGSLYIDDSERIRKVGPDGIITTVAGNGTQGDSGDGGPATQASLYLPHGVAVAPDGSLYIADGWYFSVTEVAAAFQGYGPDEFLIPSQNGRQIYRFDSSGKHLSTLQGLTGAVLYQFAYDGSGHLSKITDASGNTVVIQRDSSGDPTAIIAPGGQKTVLTTDSNGYLASVADPAGNTYKFAYTADGLMTAMTDPNDKTFQFAYDASGRLAKDSDPAGGSKSLLRTDDPTGYSVALTTGLNRLTTHSLHQLSTGGTDRATLFPDGTQTDLTQGTDGSLNATYPDGTTETALLGPDPRFGMLAPLMASTTTKTPGGLRLDTAASRTVSLTDLGDPLSLTGLTDTVSINGQNYTRSFSASTKTITTTTPAGRQWTSTIDNLGRLVSSQIAGLSKTGYAYDSKGRLETITAGSGADMRTWSFAYGADDNLASITDALGRSVQFRYDAAGRLTTEILPAGNSVAFQYDGDGNLTSITPPGRPAHHFSYTPVDLKASYDPPSVGAGADETLYTYNIDRLATSIVRPDGKTVGFGFNSAGNLSSISIPGGKTIYTYDSQSGKVKEITSPDGVTLDLTYSGALLTGRTWSGEVAGSVGYAYDNDFRVTSVSVNGAAPIVYQYDVDSLLTQAGSLALTRNAQNGLITGAKIGNVSEAWTYNTFAETSAHTASFSGGAFLSDQYTRDKLGRITEKKETIGGATNTFDYAYDQDGRLAQVEENGAVVSSYTYDSNGNRLTRTHSGATISGAYDDQDRLVQYGTATCGYTANGELSSNTVGSQKTTYQYDALGNLKTVGLPDGTVLGYIYDGSGRRIGKTVNGVLVQGFLYQNGLKPIAELDASNNVVSRFIYTSGSSAPDYMIKNGLTYRFVKDRLGSPRLVVDTTTGSIAQRMDYDEFGNVTYDSNPGFQPFGFAGGVYEGQTGLVHFGARDYCPEIGRWTTKDPIGFAGGTNLYVYLGDNPLNGIDPTGRKAPEINWAEDPAGDKYLPAPAGSTALNSSYADFFAGIADSMSTIPFTSISLGRKFRELIPYCSNTVNTSSNAYKEGSTLWTVGSIFIPSEGYEDLNNAMTGYSVIQILGSNSENDISPDTLSSPGSQGSVEQSQSSVDPLSEPPSSADPNDPLGNSPG